MGKKTVLLLAVLLSSVVVIFVIITPAKESTPSTVLDIGLDSLRSKRSSGVTNFAGRTLKLCNNPDGYLSEHYTDGKPDGTKDMHTHINEIYQDNTVSVYIDEKGTTDTYKIREYFLLDKDFNKIPANATQFTPGDCVIIDSVIVNNKETAGPYTLFRLQ